MIVYCHNRSDDTTGRWIGTMDFVDQVPCSFILAENHGSINGVFSLSDWSNHQDKDVEGFYLNGRILLKVSYEEMVIEFDGVVKNDFTMIEGLYRIIVLDEVRRKGEFNIIKQ